MVMTSPFTRRLVLAWLPRLSRGIVRRVADECGTRIVQEALTCDEALRMIRAGLDAEFVIGPMNALAPSDAESLLGRRPVPMRLLAMSASRRGVASYELRLLGPSISWVGLKDAVRHLLVPPD
jgi:hypothetical protein